MPFLEDPLLHRWNSQLREQRSGTCMWMNARGRPHQERAPWKEPSGISVKKNSLQQLVKQKSNIFVLEESGESIKTIDLGESPVFVLGDQVGLPKKDEEFILRYGKKVSIGNRAYLASSCVGIINYILDQRESFD